MCFSCTAANSFQDQKSFFRLGAPLIRELPLIPDRPIEYNWTIAFDSSNRAYIGGERLWQWDGEYLDPLGPESSKAIRTLLIDENDVVWIGGSSYFGFIDKNSGDFVSQLYRIEEVDGFPGPIWDLFKSEDNLWVAFRDTLYRLNEREVSFWDFDGEHRTLFHLIGDSVYAHMAGFGLWLIEGSDKVLINDDYRLNEDSLLFLGKLNDENFAVSRAGIFNLSDDFSEVYEVYDFTQDIGRPSDVIIHDGLFFISTLSGGIFISDRKGSILYHIKTISGDRGEIILKLEGSPDEGIYVCTSLGVYHLLMDHSIGSIGFNESFSIGAIRDADISKERLFISSDKGAFIVNLNDGEIEVNQLSLSQSLACELNDDIAVYSDYDNLYIFDNNEVLKIFNSNERLISFGKNEKGLVALSFSNHLQIKRLDENYKLIEAKTIPFTGYVARLEADGTGRIWGWGPRMGLLEVWEEESGEVAHRWHEEAGGIALREEGHSFAMGAEGPVLHVDGALVRKVAGGWERSDLGAVAGEARAMDFPILEGDGTLRGWMAYWEEATRSNLLVEVIWPAGAGLRERRVPWLDMKELGKVNTLKVAEVEEGRLVFLLGGLEGVLLAEEGLEEQVPVPREPVVYGAERQLAAPAAMEVDYGKAPLRFHYSSPGAGLYYPVRYQNRVTGWDEAWTQPSTIPLRELGSLPAGHYGFEVRAVDPFGRVSPVTRVNIRIFPPWYQTGFAIAGYVILGFLAVWLFTRFRERHARARQAALEEVVEERTKELRRANEFKNAFIANLSHEIRNPLNGVIGFIRQLRPDEGIPLRKLEALQGASSYLKTTVEQVLDFSRLESGRYEVHLERFDIGEVAGEVVALYREAATSKGLKLSLRVQAAEGLGVVSDRRMVQQMIGNLTGNAVKFTEEGGVHLGVSLQADGNRGTLRLWVEDTGPGIAKEDQERIFDKFTQVCPEGSQVAGTGLGLTLVQNFVEVLRGHLELESSPGEGATFRVTLPVRTEPLPEAQMTEEAPLVPEGLKVLLVEDHEYNRLWLQGYLEDLGCEVTVAMDGPAGYEEARQGDFQVIFLDWDLPGMTGLEIARRLRMEGALEDGVLLVGMTAHATAEIEERCLSAGMQAFITKPIDPAKLDAVLRLPGSGDPLITAPGLLGEMARREPWETICERWNTHFAVYLEECREAIRGTDPEHIRRAAHRFLGHLRMVKAREVPEGLLDMMTAADAGDLEGARLEWKRLEPLLFRLEMERRQLVALRPGDEES